MPAHENLLKWYNCCLYKQSHSIRLISRSTRLCFLKVHTMKSFIIQNNCLKAWAVINAYPILPTNRLNQIEPALFSYLFVGWWSLMFTVYLLKIMPNATKYCCYNFIVFTDNLITIDSKKIFFCDWPIML